MNILIDNIKLSLSENQPANEIHKIKNLMLNSALLPILESAMRSGSLMEMSKETVLYNTYLDLIKSMAQSPVLAFILLDIGDEYEPKQTASVHTLIQKVAS